MAEIRNIRIGDLLTRAGVLRKQDLDEACLIAQETGQMIGKVLIMSEYITKEDLQAAVEIQALIRDGHLELELGLVALSTVFRRRITVDQALDQLGWHPQVNMPSCRLGELLVASGVITVDEMNRALDEVRESIIPLGAVLIAMGAITDKVLKDALEVQDSVRSGRLMKPDGVSKLMRYAKAQA